MSKRSDSRRKSSTQQESGFDITLLVRMLRKNWYWFVLSLVVFAVAGYVYIARLTPMYQRASVLMVKTSNKSKNLTDFLGIKTPDGTSSSGGSDMDDELYIIHSLQIQEEVVKRLNLDVSYSFEGTFRDFPIYSETPVKVQFMDGYRGYTTMKIVPQSKNTYEITEFKVDGVDMPLDNSVHKFNTVVKSPAGRIKVLPVKENLEYNLDKVVNVARTSVGNAAIALQGSIDASLVKKVVLWLR